MGLQACIRRILSAACIACCAPADAQQAMTTIVQGTSGSVVLRRQSYNYAPSVVKDGSTYHLYWCGGVAGDYILHAHATSPAGPWYGSNPFDPLAYDVAMAPSKRPGTFDSTQTCDPSVIKVHGYWYLFYGGLGDPGSLTAIGVATGPDGVRFARMNGGRPIVTAARTNPAWRATPALGYGAGQPSIAYVAPYLYMTFTDTTASGADPRDGAGQFALRTQDASFLSGLQEMTSTGWTFRGSGGHTGEHAIADAVSVDWGYDPPTGMLAMLSSGPAQGDLTLRMMDPQTLATHATGTMAMDWREGPGIAVAADRTSLSRAACGRFGVIAYAASGASFEPKTWNAIAARAAVFDASALCAK